MSGAISAQTVIIITRNVNPQYTQNSTDQLVPVVYVSSACASEKITDEWPFLKQAKSVAIYLQLYPIPFIREDLLGLRNYLVLRSWASNTCWMHGASSAPSKASLKCL